MPILTISFDNTVQSSVQINDVAYYTSLFSLGGFDTSGTSNITKLGRITSVGLANIKVDVSASTPLPTPTTTLSDGTVVPGDFIMFSKDNSVNMTSLLGYYADIKFKNNSTEQGELFSVESDYFESSK